MNTDDLEGDRKPSDYLAIVQRRRWTIALVWSGVFCALAGYAFLATPVYRASALVDIEKVNDVVNNERGGWQQPDEDYLATQAKLIVSDSALRRVYADLKLEETAEFAGGVGSLRAAASVMPQPRTRLVNVNVESADPKLAASVANALAENFVKANLDNQLFMPKDVLTALRTRASGPDARRIYEALPQVLGNNLLQDLKSQILKTELLLADLRAKYTDEHPVVQAAAEQLRLIRATRERELDIVVRSVTTALSGQLRPNNVRVVDPAMTPKVPARPRRELALAIGLIGGLGLALLAAFVRDSLDETVRTHNDLERRLGLQLLGEIPHARDEGLAREAFRDLRTMVAIAGARTGDPFLLVTSTVQDEGKSFVATNLAVAVSQLDRKVLIIDGDLRRPSQHLNLGGSTEGGLSDFLSGKIKNVEGLIRKTDLPNLELLPAGLTPPNASELLNAKQLEELVAWARGRYDRVIVDCPPVFPVGDVLLWGRHARSSILISRCGRAKVPLVQMACGRLRAGGIDVLGGVLNGSRPGALTSAYGRYFEKNA